MIPNDRYRRYQARIEKFNTNISKQLFLSCLLDMRLVIWLSTISYSTRAHDIIVNKTVLSLSIVVETLYIV